MEDEVGTVRGEADEEKWLRSAEKKKTGGWRVTNSELGEKTLTSTMKPSFSPLCIIILLCPKL